MKLRTTNKLALCLLSLILNSCGNDNLTDDDSGNMVQDNVDDTIKPLGGTKVTIDPKDPRCANGCITGFLGHGRNLSVGESLSLTSRVYGMPDIEFRDASDWTDSFEESFLSPYYEINNLNSNDFGVSFTPAQARATFASNFEVQINGNSVSADFDESGNFTIHSLPDFVDEPLHLLFSKVMTIEFENWNTGLVRYQCLVIQAKSTVERIEKSSVTKKGKLGSFEFAYTTAWRPCLKTIDLLTVPIVDPLLSGFTNLPAGEEYRGIDYGPDIYFSQKIPTSTSHVQQEISFRSTLQGVRFKCKFMAHADPRSQESSFEDCSSPLRKENLADGKYSLLVRSFNENGTGLSIASTTLEIDTIPPEPLQIKNLELISTDESQQLIVHFEQNPDLPASRCKINSQEALPCQNPWLIETFPQGLSRLTIYPSDLAGNTLQAQAFFVDPGQEPILVPASEAAGQIFRVTGPEVISNANFTSGFTISSTLAYLRFECAVFDIDREHSIETEPCVNGYQPYISLPDGTYNFIVHALDTRDNTIIGTQELPFTLDTTAPGITDLILNCNTTPNGNWFRVQCSADNVEQGSMITWKINAGNTVYEDDNSFQIESFPAGEHFLQFQIRDQHGNTTDMISQTLIIGGSP